jgi:prokaryotic ubiquitin-like protein Pup
MGKCREKTSGPFENPEGWKATSRARITLQAVEGTSLKGTEDAQMATKDTGGQRQTTRRTEETEEDQAAATEEVRERHEKLSDDVDSILDEIDEVLEENAEEFVRSYVQKGGE